MDKIIALYGGANVGKSTTFMELATMLPEPIDTLHWNKSDYRATFMVNGKKVCICTWGDNRAELDRNIAYFHKMQPDIAVTATRTWGKTVEAVEEYAKEFEPHAPIEWIRICRTSKEDCKGMAENRMKMWV